MRKLPAVPPDSTVDDSVSAVPATENPSQTTDQVRGPLRRFQCFTQSLLRRYNQRWPAVRALGLPQRSHCVGVRSRGLGQSLPGRKPAPARGAEQGWPNKRLVYQQQLDREGQEMRKAERFLG